MGFDARFVSRLDYDFSIVKNCENIVGVSPDPTDEQVWQFQVDMSKSAKILGQDFDPDDQQAMMEFMEGLTSGDFRKVKEHMINAITTMLDNKPSKEELERVSTNSYRHFQAYQGSLMGDIMDPKIVKKLITND